MMYFVTARTPGGTRAATNRHATLAATTHGAAFQTIRKTGGMFRNPLIRSCHLDRGCCSSPPAPSMPLAASPASCPAIVLIAPAPSLSPVLSCLGVSEAVGGREY